MDKLKKNTAANFFAVCGGVREYVFSVKGGVCLAAFLSLSSENKVNRAIEVVCEPDQVFDGRLVSPFVPTVDRFLSQLCFFFEAVFCNVEIGEEERELL